MKKKKKRINEYQNTMVIGVVLEPEFLQLTANVFFLTARFRGVRHETSIK